MKTVLEHDVEMKTRDGCVLRAHVHRPDDAERHPVLLARTPYGKDAGASGPSIMLAPEAAVGAGYVFVVQDVRGTGASEGGPFVPYRDEGADGYDAVEWAASLPYADGTVSMHGISYLAGTAWQAAAADPPSLRSLFCVQGLRDYYDVWWRGGALRVTDLIGWTLFMRFQAVASRRAGSPSEIPELLDALDDLDHWVRHTPLTTLPPAQPDDRTASPAFFDVLAHPVPDSWTRSAFLGAGLRHVRVPAVILTGWYDRMLSADLQNYADMRTNAATQEAREHTRLIIGPWSHGKFEASLGEADFGFRANGMAIDMRESTPGLQVKWFDQWQRTKPSSTFETPPVWLFVQGVNRWRQVEDWPPRATAATPWYLGPEGTLGTETPPADCPPTSYVYDPHDPCPTRGGAALMLPAKYPIGPADQRPVLGRQDVVAYTSETLPADLEVIGPVRAVLNASTSAPDTDWVVKLCDVHPDGRVLSVTDGILRARYRHGLDAASLVQPGAVERYEIELDPTAMVFKAGHRLQVIVTSSDFPRYDRNPNTGALSTEAEEFVPAHQTLFHDASRASHIVLPVQGAPTA